MPEQSLYERLGGVNAIAMVVDRFSDQIIANPKLNLNPSLKEWNTRDQLQDTLDLPGCRRAFSVHRQGHARSA